MNAITIQQALDNARIQLQAAGDNPRLEAELLLAHALNCERATLHAWPERALSAEQHNHYQQLIARRVYGEPIAHILGRREFWEMTLKVTKDTLIPRPETERLVELALERITPDAAWRILDLGTGSGPIALAIARARPRSQVLATDLSAAALAVARDNAQHLAVSNIRFQTSHWFEQLGAARFQLIVANPPYIAPDDPHLRRGDLRFEPLAALRAHEGGLADLRAIAEQARAHLDAPGWLLLEHGHDQGPAMHDLLAALGYREVAVYKDLGGHDRVTAATWAAAAQET